MTDPAALARSYYDCFNEWRFGAAAEFVAPDAAFHVPASRQQFRGPEGFWSLLGQWLNAFADARIEIRAIRKLSPDSVSVEFVGRGTHTGLLTMGPLQLPASGRRIELLFRDRLTVRDGRVIESVLDFNTDDLVTQLSAGE